MATGEEVRPLNVWTFIDNKAQNDTKTDEG